VRVHLPELRRGASTLTVDLEEAFPEEVEVARTHQFTAGPETVPNWPSLLPAARRNRTPGSSRGAEQCSSVRAAVIVRLCSCVAGTRPRRLHARTANCRVGCGILSHTPYHSRSGIPDIA
jgi:hypothetical protein